MDKSTADLWRELRKEESILRSYTCLSKNDGWWVQPAKDSGERLEFLRAQLLDRCKRVDESDGYYTEFAINEYVIATHYKPNGSPKHKREDAPATAREMSVAYAFWAWELEQRQRESNDGSQGKEGK